MKEKCGKVEYKGKEYKIYFNLNVMEAIQEEFGSMAKWGELTDREEPSIKAIKFVFWKMINEGIMIHNDSSEEKEELFTLEKIGRMLTDIGIDELSKKLNETVIESTENEEKNA